MGSAPDAGDDLDCPDCGCNDCSALRSADSTARAWKAGAIVGLFRRRTVTRRCNHCGHRWTSSTNRQLAGGPNDE